MSKPIEAIYEEGRLRPLEPLPLSDGDRPSASDALFILNVGVGLSTCEASGKPQCVCDVNASDSVVPTAIRNIRRFATMHGKSIVVLLKRETIMDLERIGKVAGNVHIQLTQPIEQGVIASINNS